MRRAGHGRGEDKCAKQNATGLIAKLHPLNAPRLIVIVWQDQDIENSLPNYATGQRWSSAKGRISSSRQPQRLTSGPGSAGCFHRWNRSETRKGTGFQQPLSPHEHWHVDISYVNVCGTFYFLLSVLDGASRYLVHHELREGMKEIHVEIVLQRAREKFPGQRLRIISDNGPQFIARDFKEFIRLCGMTHVRTSSYYPQSNGKVERWDGTLKRDCLRPSVCRCRSRGPRVDCEVRGGLQSRPASQRHRLRDIGGQAGWPGDAVHRAGRALGERLCRVVLQPTA
jgi:transposase InsO family protein